MKQPGQPDEQGLGWLTIDEAKERLGEAQLVVSASHSLCPPCGDAWDKAEAKFFDD